MDNVSIDLKLTAAQVNLVLAALGQRPFGEVFELIGEIKRQGDAAMERHRVAAAAAPVEAPVAVDVPLAAAA